MCVCVCVRVCTFLKKPEGSLVQVERKGIRKEKKEEKTLCHGLSAILSWLSYLYFVKDFKDHEQQSSILSFKL